jgi:predicted transcriptional regulator
MMKTIQLTFSDDYCEALELIAAALGESVSDVVVQALENTWNMTDEQREEENKPLPF